MFRERRREQDWIVIEVDEDALWNATQYAFVDSSFDTKCYQMSIEAQSS